MAGLGSGSGLGVFVRGLAVQPDHVVPFEPNARSIYLLHCNQNSPTIGVRMGATRHARCSSSRCRWGTRRLGQSRPAP